MGSGKSTLVSTLLRLLEIVPPSAADPGNSSQAGQVLIDGLSIETVPRETLRSRILAIPQESIVLQGSVRYNLDPTNIAAAGDNESTGDGHKLHDNLMISTLRSVGLWEMLEARGGLNGQITKESLSRGQMQLLALARTIARKNIANAAAEAKHLASESPPVSGSPDASTSGGGNNIASSAQSGCWAPKILLLDEATSQLDAETDATVQRLIREEFKDFTIIMVAHRIESVADADMVGVMEAGRLVRFGPPGMVIGTDVGSSV